MTLTLITQPDIEPITLSEVKAHCRIEHRTDDTLITSLTTAAGAQTGSILIQPHRNGGGSCGWSQVSVKAV